MKWRILALSVAFAQAAALWMMPGYQPGPALFLVVSATIGVLHGALDIAFIGARPGAAGAMRLQWPWLALYGASVLAAIAVLVAVPALVLPVLLVLSVVHFGYAHAIGNAPGAIARWGRVIIGCAPVAAPTWVSYPQLVETLAALPGGAAAQTMLAWWLLAGLWFASVPVFLGLAWHERHSRRLSKFQLFDTGAEVITVFTLNVLLDPLSAFSLYFGLMHCTRHIAAVRRSFLASASSPWPGRLALWVGIASLATVLCAGFLVPASAFSLAWFWVEAALVVTAAITLPHTILVARHARRLYG